jgi:hypothetical protein
VARIGAHADELRGLAVPPGHLRSERRGVGRYLGVNRRPPRRQLGSARWHGLRRGSYRSGRGKRLPPPVCPTNRNVRRTERPIRISMLANGLCALVNTRAPARRSPTHEQVGPDGRRRLCVCRLRNNLFGYTATPPGMGKGAALRFSHQPREPMARTRPCAGWVKAR